MKKIWQWFLSLFEKKVKYPIITSRNVVIDNDEAFLRQHQKRKEEGVAYFRKLSRFQGQKRFVKTGRNDKF